MKKTIIKIILYFALIITACFLWHQANSIIITPKSEGWAYPTIAFSLFFVLWAMIVILVRNKWEIYGVSIIALATSLLWINNLLQVVILLIASLAIISAVAIVKEEISLRIKFSAWNSLRTGRRFLIFGIALIISGQYYFSTLNDDNDRTVPKIQVSQWQTDWALDIMAKINPQLGLDKDKDTTVDEFIESQILIQGGNANSTLSYSEKKLLENLPAGMEKRLMMDKNNLAIKEGREQLAKMIGREVSGNEKIAEVFAELINEKINKILNIDIGYVDNNIPLTHILLAGVTFLLVSSVGAFVSVILILVIKLLFMTMLKLKIIESEEKEEIIKRLRIV